MAERPGSPHRRGKPAPIRSSAAAAASRAGPGFRPTSSSRASGATHMRAPASLVLGKALKPELAPAETVAHRTRGDDRGLRATDGQSHVGAREQPAPPPQADAGAIEAETEVGQHGADDAGNDADQHQQHDPGERRRHLVRNDEVADRVAGAEQAQPEPAAERIEAEHIAERLREAEQAREDRQREVERAREQQPLQIHRINRRSVGRSGLRRRVRRDRRRLPAPRPDQLPQLLRALEQDRLQDAFFLAAPSRRSRTSPWPVPSSRATGP